jgi:copper homeostasis protein (lipoprotein)
MKKSTWFILGVVILVVGIFAYQQFSAPQGDVTLAVYKGSLPCADCEKITTTLTLYQDAETQEPSKYVLEQNFVGGKTGKPLVKKGNWAMQQGFPDHPDATVIALNHDQPKTRQLYAWQVNANELNLLNQDHGKITKPLNFILKK